MKKITITICLLFTSPLLWAKTVIVQSQPESSSEFEAFIAVNSKYSPYAKQHIKKLPSSNQLKGLQFALSEAQRSYLNETLAKAENDFKKLIGFSHVADWRPQQRKTIIYGYLRLAQLTKNKTLKESRIQEAAYFSMGISTDKELFPEEILKAYKKYQNQPPQIYWTPGNEYKNYKYILINGKVFVQNKKATFALPKTKVRITLVSNSYLPESYVLPSKDLLQGLTLNKTKLVQGDCKTHQFHTSVQKKQLTAFFNESCLSLPVKKPIQEINHQALTPLNQPAFKKTFLNPQQLPSPFIKNEKSVLKSRWVWLTVGFSAAILFFKKSSSKKSTSSIRNGF